jgi:hypothetical protein
MQGKIDENGALWIMRAGEWRKQMCPFAADQASCSGRWCPLFGEPEKLSIPLTSLSLCHKMLSFEVFTDERNPPEKEKTA